MMNEITSSVLGEKYYEIDHASGLKVLVYPMQGYTSAYAAFATKYGSIDTCFRLKGEKEFTTVPEGIAHFLEHKLFESEELDAFERYAKTGASANAYTSFDKTCYLFSCADHFDENLEILLDFVTHPYFTKETVEKEQGIIGQEITMYYDEPGWMATFNLLRCLYKNHPVRIDIAGTCESIAQITDKLLYSCYNTFYNLSNMVLAVAGNITPQQVLAVCDRVLKPCTPIEIERSFTQEPDEIVSPLETYHLAVGVPVFAFGYKELCPSPEASLPEIVQSNIILEALAGKTSPLYNEMLESGLLNQSFSYEYFTGFGYRASLFDGESTDPQRVAEKIRAAAAALKQNGLSEEAFETARRSLYGREIMEYNEVDSVANAMMSAYFAGYSIFDVLEAFKKVTLEQVNNRLQTVLRDDHAALSIVKEKENV